MIPRPTSARLRHITFLPAFLAVLVLAPSPALRPLHAADATGGHVDERGPLAFQPPAHAQYAFGGPVGGRIDANLEHWLLRAPQANPGMLDMFRVRDRRPVPQLVPWAGEFVGKYLFSAIQALRMTDDPRLRQQVSNTVAAFIATQAEDGYLGPFPEKSRLLGNWDLWGHYHAIQALLRWHAESGDPAALAAARRAGDLVCRTYLDTGRRVYEAGDPEMNMAILTGLAMLHRATGDERYLRLVREVEKDWERAGDYLRAGLDGREFYQSPRPRWESLHDLQGLLELWRITGDPKYRTAFEHHWRSIRRWDLRNSGGFSSGEQATGNPYAPTAIETCCTVAWMALTLDYLQLTGDARAADTLELATFNGGLGAQHPSGRWWTYSTPMDGAREASAHTIVFQSRAGTPELNCCSVNAPRVLGVLADWAVMSAPDGLVLNWLAPMDATAALAGHPDRPVRITVSGDYPVEGQSLIRVDPPAPGTEFTLRIRIPAWAAAPQAWFMTDRQNPPGPPTVGPNLALDAIPGTYLVVRRSWQPGDQVGIRFEQPLRAVPGAAEAAGKVSLYRGPLLLAWDQILNPHDEDAVPALDLPRLLRNLPEDVRLVESAPPDSASFHQPRPIVQLELRSPIVEGQPLRLVDFASAGATGARYRSWLPARPFPAPPSLTQHPRDGAAVPPGPIRFQWRAARPIRPAPGAEPFGHRVEFADNPAFAPLLLATNVGPTNRLILDLARATQRPTAPDRPLFWRVVALGPAGETLADVPPAGFRIDPAAPAEIPPPELRLGPAAELVVHSLRGEAAPAWGPAPVAPTAGTRSPDGVVLDGRGQMVVYELPAWPAETYSVSLRARFAELPSGRIAQLFSGWTASQDDPLRLVIDKDRLFARIEAGGGYSTPGFPVETGRWYRIQAVRDTDSLALWVDGREIGKTPVPESLVTQSRACALGGNPRFGGNEFLAATLADFRFLARALSAEELRAP